MEQTKFNWNDIPLSYWLGVVFFILVCVGIVVSASSIYSSVMKEQAMPVSSLVIHGDSPYSTEQEIKNAIKKSQLNNFFKLDVNQVQQNLEQLPWVYSASVRKQWPNEVSVYVIDQQPVAQWNDDFFINRQGVIFQADKARVPEPLPKLFGPEGSELLALENYRNINELLVYIKAEIAELVLTERHAWQITLNDGVLLNLGREDRIKRIQRFMDSYQQIKRMSEKNLQVDYIDLRYDTGMAVGWKPSLVVGQEEQKTNA